MSSTNNSPTRSPVTGAAGRPRVLALDVGSRTIGLAITDPLGITAQGLQTIRRKNKRTDLDHLRQVVRDYNVSEIVVGYPLRMSGGSSAQSEKVSAFADELRAKFQLPVYLWDERLTSAEANRLLRGADISIRRRAALVDQVAAVLILQNFLEYRTSKSEENDA